MIMANMTQSPRLTYTEYSITQIASYAHANGGVVQQFVHRNSLVILYVAFPVIPPFPNFCFLFPISSFLLLERPQMG